MSVQRAVDTHLTEFPVVHGIECHAVRPYKRSVLSIDFLIVIRIGIRTCQYDTLSETVAYDAFNSGSPASVGILVTLVSGSVIEWQQRNLVMETVV